MDIAYRINLTRAWLKRKRAKGIEPNADEVWGRIRTSWPAASDEQAERIFQGSR